MSDRKKFIDENEYIPLDVVIKENVNTLWCRELFDVEEIHNETKGENIKIGVIDTGTPQHEDLNIAGIENLTECEEYDLTGHSTHICGIISGNDDKLFGVAPKSEIYSIKALDDSGISSFDDIHKALVWCYKNDMHVVNMSLGSAVKPYNDNEFRDIIDKLYKKGVVICAASGNQESKNRIANYPAEYEHVLSIGGISKVYKFEKWCNINCDFVAPSSAYSCYLNNKYARLRGTSQACGFISGTVALIKSYYNDPFMNYDDVYNILKKTSKTINIHVSYLPQPNSILDMEKGVK
jgi:subtilisin family serine protease